MYVYLTTYHGDPPTGMLFPLHIFPLAKMSLDNDFIMGNKIKKIKPASVKWYAIRL